MKTLQKTLAGMALASTLALGGCFDTVGALRQQISPRPVTQMAAVPVDAEINRFATDPAYRRQTMVNQVQLGGGRVAYAAMLLDAAVELRKQGEACEAGADVLVLAVSVGHEFEGGPVLVCLQAKTGRARVVAGIAYAPDVHVYYYGMSMAYEWLVTTSGQLIRTQVGLNTSATLDLLAQPNPIYTGCLKGFVPGLGTLFGTVTPARPLGRQVYVCTANPYVYGNS